MYKLKEFYQYKRFLKKSNAVINFNESTFSTKLKKKPIVSKPYTILHVKSSSSNTLVTLTNLKGKVLMSLSCGNIGFTGKKKKSTKFAVVSTLEKAVGKMKELGYGKTLLCLNGFARARFYIIRCLKKKYIRLVGVRDVTSIPHNGCRPKKLRRG